MSEFELKPEDLKRKVLTRWKCEKCDFVHSSFDGKPTHCGKCQHQMLRKVVNVKTVPVSTGLEVEFQYDNLDSIDDANNTEYEIEEQNRDLEKLEKARREQ